MYLDARLGLDIPPAEVRMHPRADDAYEWSVLPDSQHLFRQNLSKLTSREYTQLIRGIGMVFEAVRRGPISAALKPCPREDTEHHLESQEPGETFTSNIERLSSEVSSLRQEASLLKAPSENELQARAKLEIELRKAQSAYVALRRECTKSQNNARRLGLVARVKESNRGIRHLANFSQKLEERSKISLVIFSLVKQQHLSMGRLPPDFTVSFPLAFGGEVLNTDAPGHCIYRKRSIPTFVSLICGQLC